MKVLVVGSGGREHAICWKLSQSPQLEELYCAPGNPGIAEVADRVPIAVEEIRELADFAAELKIDLTVVGPELPLVLGIADEFASRGLAIFGPSRRASELEGSKVFARQFMQRHGIPAPAFEIAHDEKEARRAARKFGFPVVLKADGLAAGKGVLIAADKGELNRALTLFFEEREFGSSGDRILVEEHLVGEEISLIALSDGERLLPLAPSKDYKRIGENDQGPNTGGMGSHSPSGVLAAGDAGRILEQVMRPTVRGMAEENSPFVGVLYAGLMLCDDGPKVLEFNVRLGDPEAQCLLLRLGDDLLPALASGAAGHFSTPRLRFRKEAGACIVLASKGYPGKPVSGEPISGLEHAAARPGVVVFHAGTAEQEGEIVTAGGRVLNVCAAGPDLRAALQQAYAAAAEIAWPSKVMRSDIGRRVLEGHRS